MENFFLRAFKYDKMRLATKSPCFKSKFITAELAHVFSQSDSEDEEFVGFSNEEGKGECFGKRLDTRTITSVNDSGMDTGFYSDGEEEACAPKRKSLCVALRFPTKRLPTLKQQLLSEKKMKRPFTTAPPSMRTSRRAKQQQQQKDVAGGEVRAPSVGLLKRDKNIEENKAMLAKLFAELDAMADLTPLNTPQKRRTSEKIAPRKRRLELESGSERRNPSRKARPPENFGVEINDHSPERRCHVPRTVLIRRQLKVDRKHVAGHGKNGMSHRVRKSRYVMRSVEEITKEELDNICYRTKDKIYDKDTGSSCHQCRQKTLDTKTVCRSGFCVGVKGQFCGPCLKNRYGEDVRTVLLDPTWSCPLCRRMCNCSLCRRLEGRCATGTLVGLARYNGHDNVHEYLASIQKGL